MKLKELKKLLDKLPVEELEKELLYNSEEYAISGVVNKLILQKVNLYYTGEDDPSALYTKKELIENGYDSEEIEEMEVEIPKGSYVIEL